MKASDYRARAREVLSGNWLLSTLVALIATLLGGAVTSGTSSLNIDLDNLNGLNIQLSPTLIAILQAIVSISVVIAVIRFIIGGTIKLGHCQYLLDQQNGNKLSVRTLFSQFNQFGNGFCLELLTTIFVFLWSLLLVIPGIVASYSYAMAPFIQTELYRLAHSCYFHAGHRRTVY